MVTLIQPTPHNVHPADQASETEWKVLSLGASCKLLGRLTAELSSDAHALVRLRVFEAAVEDGLSLLARGALSALHVVDLTLMGSHLKNYAQDGNHGHLAAVDSIVTTSV